MNQSENPVEKKIMNLSPRYLEKYEDLLRRYSQFGGGAEDERYTKGRYFSNVYEFYTFAFFLGLYKQKPLKLTEDDKLKTFWEVKNWQPQGLVKNLIACAISKSDFDMYQVQYLDSDSLIASEVGKIRTTMESYANGGFEVVTKEIESNPDHAEQDDFFIRMLA
jgi:hypothetical protein